MMGHRIGDKTDIQFRGDLFDDRGLTDTRSADQKDRSLLFRRYAQSSMRVLCAVGDHGISDLVLGFLNMHVYSSPSRMYLIAHGGTDVFFSSDVNRNAVL